MKTIIITAVILFSTILCHSQELLNDSLPDITLPKNDMGKLEYQGIVDAPGVKASELFSKALILLSKLSESHSTVTTLSDKSSGTIIFKYLINGPLDSIRCLVALDFKDNKFRYTFNSFTSKMKLKKNEPMKEFKPDMDQLLDRKFWLVKAHSAAGGVQEMIEMFKKDISGKDNW